MSIYTGGINGQSGALATFLLEPYETTRFDDGNSHDVRIEYLAPTSTTAAGRLEIYLDNSSYLTLAVPITLNHTLLGSTPQGDGTAYVGFTASTGVTSERHDIRSFSFCHLRGCAAV